MQCKNLNCTQRTHVNATTDIAGSGVIAAFLASALLTILAIIYAYISDSLPQWYLNETDRTVISSIQRWLPTRQTRQQVRKMWFKIKRFCCRPFGIEPSPPTRLLNRAERQELIIRFLLTLSDQQLATGIAILVAATANQCSLSVYEFQVAFSLAWFSSTTHLATLDCLQDYFRKHGVVRNWRVIGMTCLLILVSYGLLMTMASIDESIPVACTFQYFGEDAVNSHDPISVYLVLSAAFTLAFLIWNYVVRILWSYRSDDGRLDFIEKKLFNIHTKGIRKNVESTKQEYKAVRKEAVLEMRARKKRTELERINEAKGVRRHLLILLRTSRLYSESFLSTGPLLVFMASYGVTQLYVNRWNPGIPVSIDNSMNFGQITPLFLLVLPFLAAGEIYYEVKDQDHLDHPAPMKQRVRIDTKDSSKRTEALAAALGPISHPLSDDPDDRYLEPSRQLYDQLLSDIQMSYHSESKRIRRMESSATTDAQYDAVLRAKYALLSRFRTLHALEIDLAPSTLTSLLEFLINSAAGLALGILLNTDDPNPRTTIAGIVILGFYVAYKTTGPIGHIYDNRLSPSAEEYRELLVEVKESIGEEDVGVKRPEPTQRMSTASYRTAISQPVTGFGEDKMEVSKRIPPQE